MMQDYQKDDNEVQLTEKASYSDDEHMTTTEMQSNNSEHISIDMNADLKIANNYKSYNDVYEKPVN